ncbi:MAG: sigma-54 dependent transcriptional regulator [candidate division KSB1 bacterium]|nr:sigma-54 dependent transcriptional regulator [candidate division KSB1 bacterium]MDZ7275255.1 sigma-54 dependent transcriptional regulator [candidate division KSB1 bacterium]MDZ7287423.1 sigma-54 dependent transcriptional regulator [candidate division KSB1 bacterium]MDZ7299537.1 sigma-54 dependent transcriptional regulator [candidate division KSB1 bacterium]MDZ7309102.1 sigma-54 dependent transcriptional regulator [candidate division KSB1 bacterium]
MPPKVLVVDDETNILKTMGICFEAIGFHSRLLSKPQEVLETLQQEKFDLAFVDLKMGPMDGLEILAEIKRHSPETTVVIITAHGSIDSAVETIKKGAYHYLQKPFDYKELQIFAQKAWEHHELMREVRELREQVAAQRGSGEFITRNRSMLEMLDLASRVAESNISVLIEGESGTGKELVAQLIYQKSPRAGRPFVKVNCAALPENLLESELFGHVKGAFTGAVKDRQGRFALADGGTIFLDEIAELSPAIQAKLLRVLQNKEFERVGESKTTRVDVRVIAATNKNLDEALKEGTFREDLFYRLNTMRLKLLPLRERPEDIPLLIQHFLRKFSPANVIELAPEAAQALRVYRWSGNVRELEHVIERAVLLAKNHVITLDHLPEEVRSTLEKPQSALSLEEMEKLHIKRVLQHARDYDEAAQILGIDPATLWRKRKKYGL